MAVELVIFDLDGTLVDSRRDLEAAVNATLRELGLAELPRADIESAIGRGVSRLLQRTIGGEEALSRARPIFDRHYAAGLLDTTAPYPGVDALVRDLAAGANLAVATNKPGEWARQIVGGLGWQGWFSKVVGAGDVDRLKPAPDMLELLLAHTGIAAEATVVIGDMDVDVQFAHGAGVRCVGVGWGLAGRPALEAAGADWVVDSAGEVGRLLKKIGSRGRSQEGGV